ncbi:hypothetical protein BN1012_Phect541 [Candidatus Phaeomarinobacter ectocarpi]|uniref:Uncharacterized protein n=1 Tax=Candidatus Phaeomarinibacter ectocarpi TaxID=1458461 RepID=X5MKN8_9HYPH|nr:hypothetical protein [Candidatus Phaeomarinobacter ectocarpi]CDO58755.1 hypothetical protein BN1012_Phect541 [Candidatus Phaeomarinobacter ectocarpi]
MLDFVLGRHGSYPRYAAVIASVLALYLFAGFNVAKFVFTGEAWAFGMSAVLVFVASAIGFAAMHIVSMRQLDG